jgi:hypothetical protein
MRARELGIYLIGYVFAAISGIVSHEINLLYPESNALVVAWVVGWSFLGVLVLIAICRPRAKPKGGAYDLEHRPRPREATTRDERSASAARPRRGGTDGAGQRHSAADSSNQSGRRGAHRRPRARRRPDKGRVLSRHRRVARLAVAGQAECSSRATDRWPSPSTCSTPPPRRRTSSRSSRPSTTRTRAARESARTPTRTGASKSSRRRCKRLRPNPNDRDQHMASCAYLKIPGAAAWSTCDCGVYARWVEEQGRK